MGAGERGFPRPEAGSGQRAGFVCSAHWGGKLSQRGPEAGGAGWMGRRWDGSRLETQERWEAGGGEEKGSWEGKLV